MANNTVTEPVAESVAPVAQAGPVAPVALEKKGKINMLDLGHVLRGLQLCMLERDDVVYMKASWVIVFFYECHTDCIEHIMKDLRDTKELGQEIVTLKVGKYEGEWFTLAGAKMVLGMVPYQMTRKERAELAEEFKKFEKVKPAGEGKAGEARAAPEVVKLKDGQESVIKMRQEEGKDEDGDGWRYERVVWLCGKVLMRDVVKHCCIL